MSNLESLKYFSSEFVLIFGVLVLVVMALFKKRDLTAAALGVTVTTLALALLIAALLHYPQNLELFMGMVTLDPFGQFFKVLIIATAIVAAILSDKSSDLHHPAKIEFFAFLLAITLGLNVLAASHNLIMIYLTIEISSVLSYLLTGYMGSKRAEEASIKYVLYGGLASGIMIYGMSLLYGLTGSLDLIEIRQFLATQPTDAVVLFITFILILAGLGYKMAIAPFHMWSPDVYEGAPIPVTAYLSVASKAGGFAVTLRFFLVAFIDRQDTVWAPLIDLDWQTLIGVLSVLTMTLGNLVALRQTNIKRFLAYSSIAHAGYMLMALAAQSIRGVESILFYFLTYFLMNMGAFLVVILIANQFQSEEIEDYKGLAKRSFYGLVVSLCLSVFLFSLVGLPPFAGFVGKWYLFQAVLESKLYALAVIGAINSVISLYYYVRVIKFMLIDDPKSETPMQNSYMRFSAMMVALAALTLYFGIFFDPLSTWSRASASFLY